MKTKKILKVVGIIVVLCLMLSIPVLAEGEDIFVQKSFTLGVEVNNGAARCADIFVFPSNFEGFPLSMLEAQAAGLYCFVSSTVTTEVDCGLATFLPLQSGAQVWAKQILQHCDEEGTEKKTVDMTRFTKETFAENFFNLYRKSENA